MTPFKVFATENKENGVALQIKGIVCESINNPADGSSPPISFTHL